jgi:hypothetical protein
MLAIHFCKTFQPIGKRVMRNHCATWRRALPHRACTGFRRENARVDAFHRYGMTIAERKIPVSGVTREMDRAKEQHARDREMPALRGRIIGDRQDGRTHRHAVRNRRARVAMPPMRVRGKGNTISGRRRRWRLAAIQVFHSRSHNRLTTAHPRDLVRGVALRKPGVAVGCSSTPDSRRA